MRKLRMSELNRLSVEEFKLIEKFPIVVALDNVRSALNVGAVFRTADALKVQEVLLLGKTPSPEENPEMRKTALGGDESMVWTQGDLAYERLLALKSEGYSVYGVEQTTGSVALQQWNPKPAEKTLLIFGNEVSGVSDALLALCDGCIEIPQFGTKHSFNISVSVGIVLWHRVSTML
jgi:tRNA G18 (ribose-2'-O)-methylase SpoU